MHILLSRFLYDFTENFLTSYPLDVPCYVGSKKFTLAEKYDFSGGQIENVSRKATINTILHGGESSCIDTLLEYCNVERLNHHGQKRIGFY